VLHEEINRLPECYRVPIVLCDLEGFTCEEAARRMGQPIGTVKCWRFRGRARLRDRLIRLRFAPSLALGAAFPFDAALARLPQHAGRAALRAFSEWLAAGEVSASVRPLVEGVLKTMLFSKLRTTAVSVCAVILFTAGFGALAWVSAADPSLPAPLAGTALQRGKFVDERQPPAHELNEPGDAWALTLPEAIRIGLENAGEIRVISVGGTGTPSKIAPRIGGVDLERFKAEVMSHLRSIEQQYWNLAQAYVAVSSAAKAVDLARSVAHREKTKRSSGAGTESNVAEASQRLEQFQLELVTRNSDVITTERQLRTILGLPLVNGRRIEPITAPIEARFEPDWQHSVAVMLEKKPEIVRMRAIVREAEADVSADGLIRLERANSYTKQVIQEATSSLSQFFLEIDAIHKQFMTARRLKAAAALRLESQRAFFEEGRITIDRYLDAVNQHAVAIAVEAQYKTAYNQSIVALEEAKGTLLEHDLITVVEGPKSGVSIASVPDFAVKGAWYEPPAASKRSARNPRAPQGPAASPPAPRTHTGKAQVKAESANSNRGGKTYSFQLTVGFASKPVEIRGSFTIAPARVDQTPRERH
jgi:hypothetical protein